MRFRNARNSTAHRLTNRRSGDIINPIQHESLRRGRLPHDQRLLTGLFSWVRKDYTTNPIRAIDECSDSDEKEPRWLSGCHPSTGGTFFFASEVHDEKTCSER